MFRLPDGDDERFGMEVLLPDEDLALDELLVDRTFAYTVTDRHTGTILFLGTVHDPRS